MKRISTAVLTAALVTGLAGVTIAVPAVAKKKEEAKPASNAVSKEVGVAVEKAKAASAAKDSVALEAAVVEVEAAAKTDYEKYLASYLRYVLIQDKIYKASSGTNGVFDPAPMIAPLDQLIANPTTPADMRPQFEYSRATIAYDQQNWALATQLFTAAQTHGSTQANLPLYLAKTKIQGGNAAGGMADLDALFASGKPQTDDFYRYAIQQSYNAGLRTETVKWMGRWVVAYPTSKGWRTALAFYGFSAKPLAKLDKRAQVDLFRLMRQTKALADQNDYEEYAQRAIDIGLPDEAKMVIDEGKATGKIPAAPSSVIKALASDAAAQITAEGSFDALEKKAAASPTGPLSAQTGDAYLGRSNYAKAVALYRQALTKGGVNNDEVNTHLGIALAMSGDAAGAKAAFALVTGAPRNDIAAFWTIYLDHPPTS